MLPGKLTVQGNLKRRLVSETDLWEEVLADRLQESGWKEEVGSEAAQTVHQATKKSWSRTRNLLVSTVRGTQKVAEVLRGINILKAAKVPGRWGQDMAPKICDTCGHLGSDGGVRWQGESRHGSGTAFQTS